jgi:hypothetical protein
MSNSPNARNRAQSHFKTSEQREDAIRTEIRKERAAVDAKTARLKALRLAKEAEEQVEADRVAAVKSEEKARIPVAKSAKKPRKS